jgi:hypothetical protein
MEEGSMKRIIGLLVAALWMSAAVAYDPSNRAEYQAKIAEAEAYYNNKCATVAGEKIYKTVPNVEGVLLMKIRPNRTDRELANPNWPGAAFALEAYDDSYIMSFLGYEQATSVQGKWLPITREHRGYINEDYNPKNVSNLPGYRWVDVVDEKDSKRYRYTLVKKPRPQSKIGWVDTVLDRQPAPDPAPRYGVTFEDHVIPEERAMWVASSTVKAIDLKTNEVLGEMKRYAMSYVHIPSNSNPGPWLSASLCPGRAFGASTSTRKFVDQVLIPAKEH